MDKFRSLGMSPSEVKVYLLLLNTGPLTAKEISDHAQVPFSKIYVVLNRLEKKGWITSLSGRPVKYNARPPQEAVEIAKSNLEMSMSEAAEYIAKELQPIYERRSVTLQPNLLVFYGESNISLKMLDLILRTERELLLAIHHRLETLFEYSSRISSIKMLGNRPRIKILITRNMLDEVEQLKEFGAELRYRDQMYGGGAISDDREAIIILDKDEKYSMAIWSTHHSLVELAKSYFDKLWNSSEVVV